MNEDALLTNVPEPTNEPYAIAKLLVLSFVNHIIVNMVQIFVQ